MDDKRITRPGRPPSPVEETTWLVVPTAMPTAPDLPVEGAGGEWYRIGQYLVALDRVAEIDRQPLMRYCLQWGLFARIMDEELANEQTQLIVDGRASEVLHPQLEPLIDIASDLITLAGMFGLTARTRDLDGTHGNKKSSALKRLLGNRSKIAEGKLPGPISPLLPDWYSSDMSPPAWMNTRALREFDALGSQLVNLDLFTPLDLVPIVVLSCLVDLELRAHEQMERLWIDVYGKDEEGEQVVVERKATPLYKGIKKLGKVTNLYWKDYGMSPLHRRKMPSEDRSESARETPIMFLGGKKKP